ncbi:30S ribosomal protein S5 [Geodia barretti]|uniref:30S ribosomal protein S5 n=1 Tax=Geodia barretti TaxID=519541 RepID=A0AA35XIZ7_GEOBA|nr:30S ribosomal protein S5 [Geodia barretti]
MARPSMDRDRGGRGRDRDEPELLDKLVSINRVAKVVKGGRRFGFSALVVVGDQRGRVGGGSGKAREVPEAIRKATEQARRRMVRVPLREGRTLHHDVQGRFGAGKDVVAKSVGSSNPQNMVKATFDALGRCYSPRAVAAKRNRTVSQIFGQDESAKERTVQE